MKYLICYNTIDGTILASSSKSHESSTLATGSGILSNTNDGAKLVGNDLVGVSIESVVRMILEKDGRKIAGLDSKRLSDTEVSFGRHVPNGMEGAVSFIAEGFSDPIPYTTSEKDAMIDSVKASVGHTNVDAFLMTSDVQISGTSWFVDLADSNKIKHRSTIVITP